MENISALDTKSFEYPNTVHAVFAIGEPYENITFSLRNISKSCLLHAEIEETRISVEKENILKISLFQIATTMLELRKGCIQIE